MIERAGQVRTVERLLRGRAWKIAVETFVVQVQVTSPDTKKASPFTEATDVSLEIEHVMPRSAFHVQEIT